MHECIKQLLILSSLDADKTISGEPTVSAHTLALEALYRHDYDTALRYTVEITEEVEKTGLLLQIAYQTRDTRTAEQALLSYWALTEAQHIDLQQRFPSMGDVLDLLQQILHIQDTPKEQFTIIDWLTWFKRAQQEPDDPELLSSSDRLAAISDERDWTAERIEQLNQYLLQLITDEKQTIKRPYVREALYKLIQFFVNEAGFPHSEYVYQQLYEILYVALLENQAKDELHTGFILLRLAEAQLRSTPGRRLDILQNLQEWNGNTLIPKLEAWILEVFELLIDYGLQPGSLTEWYRYWINSLFTTHAHHERTFLEGWYTIGLIIQPGQDILQRIDKILHETVQKEISKPIEELPPKYRIAIYSLQTSAAERAKKLLLQHNSELDIRICTDEVPSKSAKINAQHANLVVLVTTAMKHALSYGIGPSLKEDLVVYPEFSGSTSILRSIEGFLEKSPNQ